MHISPVCKINSYSSGNSINAIAALSAAPSACVMNHRA